MKFTVGRSSGAIEHTVPNEWRAALDLCFPSVSTLGDWNLDKFTVEYLEGPPAWDPGAAAKVFRTHGFVVARGALSCDAAAAVHQTCSQLHGAITLQDPMHRGNRNPGRYSIGASVGPGQCVHLTPFVEHLVDCQPVLDVLDCVFGAGASDELQYFVSGAGGDYCTGVCTDFQISTATRAGLSRSHPSWATSAVEPIHNRYPPPLVSVNYIVQTLPCTLR